MAAAGTIPRDWQELAQTFLITLLFAVLAAKLISTLLSFRRSDLHVVRGADLARSDEERPLLGGDGDTTEEEQEEDDDELDEVFSAATAFVAAAAADRLSERVSGDVQLQLYGLYKVATQGACSAPQPPALKMTARAKW